MPNDEYELKSLWILSFQASQATCPRLTRNAQSPLHGDHFNLQSAGVPTDG